jgi:hypothetical protein
MEREVGETDAEGAIAIEDRFKRIRISMAGDDSVEIDTEGKTPADPRFVSAHEGLVRFVNESLSFELSPQGGLSNIAISKDLKDLFDGRIPGGSGLGISEANLTDVFYRVHPDLPVEPLEVGGEWLQSVKFPTRMAPLLGEASFTYKGTAKKEGREVDVFEVSGKVDIDRSKFQKKIQPTTQSQQLTGEAWFDAAAGRLVKYTIRAKVEVKIPNGNAGGIGEITFDMATTIEPVAEEDRKPNDEDSPDEPEVDPAEPATDE